MMALLSPRLLFALVLSAALAFSHFAAYRAGKSSVRAEWDAAKVIQLTAAAKAEAENRQIELTRQQTVIEAQNAQTERNQKLQAAADSARAVSDGLRHDLAASRLQLSGASIGSLRGRITTLDTVFGECTRELEKVAGDAAAIASNARLILDAWPR